MTGVTLSDVYQKARHSLLVVRDGLERLERADASSSLGASSSSSLSPRSGSAIADLAQSVKRDLGQLQGYCAELERLWRVQPSKALRDSWKRKIEQVVEEADALKSGMEKLVGRQLKRQVEAQERVDLLQRATGHSLRIYDEEQNAYESLKRSSNMIEEAFSAGVAVLSKYSEQRERLKRAQRKALDVLNTVGLSNSVLRLIERRHRIDKCIAYGGMLLTVVVVFALWIWTH